MSTRKIGGAAGLGFASLFGFVDDCARVLPTGGRTVVVSESFVAAGSRGTALGLVDDAARFGSGSARAGARAVVWSDDAVVVVAEAPEGRAVARVPQGRAGMAQPEAERWVDPVEVGLDVADYALSDVSVRRVASLTSAC